MTFARIRVAFCSVLAALLAAGTVTVAQAPAPGRETSAASVASYALVAADAGGSRGRRRHAAERAALLRAPEREAGAAGPSCGSSSRRDRCSKTTTSWGWRTSSSTCSSRARRTFPGRASTSSSASLGLSIGAGRQRGDELRRHAVHAARADRRAGRARSRAARARGLGARRDVRPGRHRAPARHRPLRVADEPRRRRADDGQDPARAAGRVALRGPAADRQARGHRARDARGADALLSRLVSPEPDGGDRRRRRRSRRRRRDDQVALLGADQPVAGAAAAGRSTCRSSRARATPIVTDKETTATRSSSATCGPARNQGSVGGYRAIMMDQLFGGMLASRLDELSQRENPPFLRAAADRSLFPMPRTKDEAQPAGARAERRRRARPRRAGHRAPARRAVRLHRDRAGAREAGEDGRLRARRHREPGPRVGEPRRRVHAQLPPGRSAADDLAGARVPPALRARHHARAKSTRSPPTGSPISNRLVIVSAPETAGVVLPDQAQLAAAVKTATTKKLEAYVDAGAGRDADGRAAGARHDRQDDRRARTGSPSGRCRTARPSCSSRRR